MFVFRLMKWAAASHASLTIKVSKSMPSLVCAGVRLPRIPPPIRRPHELNTQRVSRCFIFFFIKFCHFYKVSVLCAFWSRKPGVVFLSVCQQPFAETSWPISIKLTRTVGYLYPPTSLVYYWLEVKFRQVERRSVCVCVCVCVVAIVYCNLQPLPPVLYPTSSTLPPSTLLCPSPHQYPYLSSNKTFL